MPSIPLTSISGQQYRSSLLVALATGVVFGLFLVTGLTTHWSLYTVSGSSMEPTIPSGSVVLARSMPTAALKPGDVILFEAEWTGEPRRTVMHDLIGSVRSKEGTWAYTKGRGSLIADPAPTLLHDEAEVVKAVMPSATQILRSLGSDSPVR